MAELSSSHGDRAVCVVLNLTDDARLPTAVARLVDQFGCVDVRVNNADILTPTKAIATSMEEWRRVMAVNLDAAFILTQEVSAGMRVAKWGQIINMSSYASKSGGVSAGTAHAVAFLASHLARFITKEVIDLNGGLHLD